MDASDEDEEHAVARMAHLTRIGMFSDSRDKIGRSNIAGVLLRCKALDELMPEGGGRNPVAIPVNLFDPQGDRNPSMNSFSTPTTIQASKVCAYKDFR